MFFLAKFEKRMTAGEATLLFGIRMEIRISDISSAITKTFIHISVFANVAWGPSTTETPGVLF